MTATLTETSRQRLMNVLTEALDTYLACNCSYSSGDEPGCDGSCTHARAKAALDELEAGAVTFPSAALEEEHPWCKWTLAFASESDWDTASSFGFAQLRDINLLLTTANGHSRPVRVVNTQYIVDDDNNGTVDRRAGIEVQEIDTEHYEPIPGREPERVAYEDIREICVF